MTLEEIWDRLCDLINADARAVRNQSGDSLSRIGPNSASSYAAPERTDFLSEPPPYRIFESAVKRLCDQGLLVLTEPKIHSRLGTNSGSCMLCECLFSTRMMPSDIVAALDKHRLLNYL